MSWLDLKLLFRCSQLRTMFMMLVDSFEFSE